jgi:hypothetical protein
MTLRAWLGLAVVASLTLTSAAAQGGTCVDDSDCGIEEFCDVDGLCTFDDGGGGGCFDDSECGIDEFCDVDGVCTFDDGGVGGGECFDDIDCSIDEFCDIDGFCVFDGGEVGCTIGAAGSRPSPLPTGLLVLGTLLALTLPLRRRQRRR